MSRLRPVVCVLLPLRQAATSPRINFLAIYLDPRFLRVAPLAALGVGTSFSLQGLWAAPWLADVARLDRPAVVKHLTLMAPCSPRARCCWEPPRGLVGLGRVASAIGRHRATMKPEMHCRPKAVPMLSTPRAALARPDTSFGKYCATTAKLSTVVAGRPSSNASWTAMDSVSVVARKSSVGIPARRTRSAHGLNLVLQAAAFVWFIRPWSIKTVILKTGLSRATIYTKRKLFPAPRRIGPNRAGWLAAEVTAWVATLPRPGE